ncbi:MAG TPA: amidohydrolase family protein [Burkholderiales bacterium]|nr:amidohydrolase family protein [Burkholderiales bacterium]
MHDEKLTPAYKAPPGACDTHFHVFGPLDKYPVAERSRYEPPYAPLEEYVELARKLGIERMVFVQPSAYGTDNTYMLESMAKVGVPCRGIVDIDEDAPDALIESLHAQGVRGVRINTSPIAPYDAARPAALEKRVRTLERRTKHLGWILEFLGPAWLTRAMMPLMRELEMDYILCHIGMFLAKDGPNQPGFGEMIELARNGRCWLKLTGPYRFAEAPDFAGSTEMVRALTATVPDRLIWGTDHPHLSFADKVGSVGLYNLLGQWIPDEAVRRKVLTDNPAKLFGFK